MTRTSPALGFYWIAIIILSLAISGCAVSTRECIKGEQQYCRVTGNFTGQWYDYYERALSCMEGGCYDAALQDLEEAISRRFDDQRRARTMGMHFMDYFPHREKGLIFFIQEQYSAAISELELSLNHFPSSKAQFYLDQARRKMMEQAKQTPGIPILTLTSPRPLPDEKIIWTRDDPVMISGVAEDSAQYITEIRVFGTPIFLEKSDARIEFNESLRLDQGRHDVDILVKNLLGGEFKERIAIHVDRIGPTIILDKITPGNAIEGFVTDESGDISLFINDTPITIPKGDKVRFTASLKEFSEKGISDEITLHAIDRIGNKTQITIPADFTAATSYLAELRNDLTLESDAPQMSLDHSPTIRIKDWKNDDIAFKESIRLEADIRSQYPIVNIHINGRPIDHPGGLVISFNRFERLVPGENIFSIDVTDSHGNRATEEIRIVRMLPKAFRLSNRYRIVIHDMDTLSRSYTTAFFQHQFLNQLICRQRFQIQARDALTELFDQFDLQGLLPVSRSEKADSILLGIIYETREGIEIAVRLVDVESRETHALADVFSDTNDSNTLAVLAETLSEKIHRYVPLVDYRIIDLSEDLATARPETWIPEKRAVKTGWPLLIYRNILPDDPNRGSDSEIITEGTLRVHNGDTVKVYIQFHKDTRIRAGDRILCR